MFTAPSYDRRNTEPSIKDSLNKPQSTLRHSHGADKLSHLHQKADLNELAEFLMNQPPPSSNFMAGQQVNSDKRYSNIRQSAMKLFTRHKTKRISCSDEHLQLPDSVVCAKTRSGSRHIAISIPSNPKIQSIPRSKPSPGSQKASTYQPLSFTEQLDHISSKSFRNSSYSASSFRPETQKKLSFAESPTSSGYDVHRRLPQENQRGTAVPAVRINSLSSSTMAPLHERWSRPSNTRTKSLHSYSPSSQLPMNMSPPKFQPMKFSNSPVTGINNFPKTVSHRNCAPTNQGLARTTSGEEHLSLSSLSPITPPKDSNMSASNSPLIFGTGTAKLARSFSGAGTEKAHIVRCATPLGLEVKTKSSNLSTPRSNSPLSFPSHPKESPLKEGNRTAPDTPQIIIAQQSRASLVNGRNSISYQSIKHHPSLNLPPDTPVSPFTNPQVCQKSRQTMSLSHIMVVANVTPDHDVVTKFIPSDLSKNRFRDFRSTPELSLPTSPDSLTSDTDESDIALEFNFSRQQSIYSTRSWDSTFGGQQNTHRCKNHVRKSLVPVDQIDSRLCKMERENALLTAALNSILKRFEELGGFRPTSPEKKNLALMDLVGEDFPCCGEVRNEGKDKKDSDKIIFNNIKY